MLNIITLQVGRMQSNCYIIFEEDNREAILIDAGDDADYIISSLNKDDINPKIIIATHGHFDHNMAAYELKHSYKISFFISEKDLFLLKKMPLSAKHFLNVPEVKVPEPDSFLINKQKFEIGNSNLEVIEIPGHTPGSVGLYNPVEKILFSGDTIFANGRIGRYDFSYSNKNDLFLSIDKILSLSEDIIIYPGHGDNTSVKKELEYHE